MPACNGILKFAVELFVMPGQAISGIDLALLHQQHSAKGSGPRLLGGLVIIARHQDATEGTQRVGEICNGQVPPVSTLADHNSGAHSRKGEVPFAGKRLNVVRKLCNT